MTRRLETPEEARQRLQQQGLSERERAELWARVAESTTVAARRRRRTWQWAAPIALGTAAAAIAIGLSWRNARPDVGASTVPPDPCVLDPEAHALQPPARCKSAEVQVNGDAWQLREGARVERVQEGARVERGRVRFRVRPRKQAGDAPFVVKVSHAELRVIGTVFEVDQAENGGTVQVSEGVIEVLWRDGVRQRVAAGERASWPRPTAEPSLQPAPEKSPDAGSKRARPTAPAPDLDAVMERLLLLRSQKRHGEAVQLLRDTLAGKGIGALQRERISYELGLALEASGAASCAHWRAHAARFGTERNARTVKQRLERCAHE